MESYENIADRAGTVERTKTQTLATPAAAMFLVATIGVLTTLIFMRGYAALETGSNTEGSAAEVAVQQATVIDLDPFLPDDATAFKAPPPPEQFVPTPGQTVVSLTFDDGWASQWDAVRLVGESGFPATFFINSGSVGQPGYLTLENLRTMAEQGHEIGGHSVSHYDLSTLPPAEAKREICLDRATLSSWGFNVRNFAYPFASVTAEARKSAMECGYNSARSLGDVRTRFGCPECDWAETVPPVAMDYTAAPANVTNEWTLEDLKDTVRNAQPLGGWVQLTFHRLCTEECDYISVKTSMFTEFLSWLKSQTEATPTVVRSVEQIIGGPIQPVVPSPAGRGPAPAGENGLVNPSLEALTDVPGDVPPNISTAGAVPLCWSLDSFGSHQAQFGAVSPGHSGLVAASLYLDNYRDGEVKLVQSTDLGECAPEVAPGRRYTLSAWYKSAVPTQFSISYRLQRGVWIYWTSSTNFAASAEYSEARWETPPIPEGVTAISFGLSLLEDGQLTTDDYSLIELQEGQPG